MKNRARQRENRRKYKGLASAAPQASTAAVTSTGRPQVIEKPWLNPEGYYDPTAYRAIRNVERGRNYGQNGRSTNDRDRAATLN